MSALRRTQSGAFTLQNAVPFDFFAQEPPIEEMEKYLIPTDSVLPFERLNLTEKGTMRILQGNFVTVDVADGLYKFYDGDSFYGIVEVLEGKAKAKTKLC